MAEARGNLAMNVLAIETGVSGLERIVVRDGCQQSIGGRICLLDPASQANVEREAKEHNISRAAYLPKHRMLTTDTLLHAGTTQAVIT